MGALETFPAASGQEAGYILDRSPVNHMANTETNETHNHARSLSLQIVCSFNYTECEKGVLNENENENEKM